MDIQCYKKEIREILSMGQFVVPRFQRPFSWEKENVEEFWDDSINEIDKDYFIGSFVTFTIDKGQYGIVDGQQRITTITMILCALRNAYARLGEQNLAQGVHGFIEKINLYNNKQFILHSEISAPYLQLRI